MKRVLVTGLSTYWGGRLAQALEQRPEVEVIVGVDVDEPSVELERTEFVKVGHHHALLRRIVHAAEIDTVLDTRLVVDSSVAPPQRAHENNVIGPMNILAACGGDGSPVRKFVFKSSAHYYGCEQDDPAFFTEDMPRPHPPRTLLEADIVEAERAVADFAVRSPQSTVTILRFANSLGHSLTTSHTRLFSLPAVPVILGFDPRYQFIHEDDIVGALAHAAGEELPGVYNAAGDGVLVLSEVLDLLDKRGLPVLPPWGTDTAASLLGRLPGIDVPAEVRRQLRFGRAIDNRKLKSASFEPRYTTRETVVEFGRHQRTAHLRQGDGYVYEGEVEEFLRRSPSVRRRGPSATLGAGGDDAGVTFDDLGADEVVAVLSSLDEGDLEALHAHESAHQARTAVLAAIDRRLAETRSS
ncbi:MAG TPA: NAD-dependent epimerase/dehydratase family protein [Solirubrobacteraceae bacterium]